jgi:hypothetical protein
MIVKAMTLIILITIFGILDYISNNKIYALSNFTIEFPMAKDEHSFSTTQTSYHIENSTSQSLKFMTNATSDGHIITNYYPYTTDQNSITISDSTIFFNFNFKMPSDTDPSIIHIQRVNLFMYVYGIKHIYPKTEDNILDNHTAFDYDAYANQPTRN